MQRVKKSLFKNLNHITISFTKLAQINNVYDPQNLQVYSKGKPYSMQSTKAFKRSGNPMVALPPPNHEAGGSIFVTLRLGHSGSFLVDENPRSQSNCLRFPHGLDTLISLNL